MPYWKAYYHLVWTTAGRALLLTPVVEEQVFRAIVATAGRLGGTVHAVNGTADHVHVVASVPPTVALFRFVGQLKGSSAHLVNHTTHSDTPLIWERGYGLFTLGPRQLDRVVAYVRSQKQHHANGTATAALEMTDT